MSRSRALYAAIITVVLILSVALPALAVSPSDFVVVTNDTYVNLRSGPGENYDKIGSYVRGVWLTVSGQSGNWYYITGPDGKTGYVSANFTSRGTETPVAVGIVSNPNPSSFLNFRAEPSYDARVLRILYNGVPVTIISRENGWYYVDVDGQKGYLRSEFLTTQTMLASESVATVTTPNNTALNLRQGPGTQYNVVRQIPGSAYLMVLMQGTEWSKVSINGYVGFVHNNYLKLGIHPSQGSSGGGSGGGGSGGGSAYALVANPVSTQLLNLREKPDTSARVLGRYVNGTRLTVLRQGTEWCQVRVDKTGATGYMMTKYLKLHNLPKTPTATVDHPLNSFVNLRKSMSMNASVLKRVSDGRTVTVLIPGDDWYKVKFDGTTGYMVEYFLSPD